MGTGEYLVSKVELVIMEKTVPKSDVINIVNMTNVETGNAHVLKLGAKRLLFDKQNIFV